MQYLTVTYKKKERERGKRKAMNNHVEVQTVIKYIRHKQEGKLSKCGYDITTNTKNADKKQHIARSSKAYLSSHPSLT